MPKRLFHRLPHINNALEAVIEQRLFFCNMLAATPNGRST
jgi:hypothetical protein